MATYYINPSTGNDSSNGTSTGTAWKTLSKANNTLVAGDTVEVIGNSIITSWSEYICPVNSGTAGNPITYKTYGTDRVTLSPNDYTSTAIRLNKDASYVNYVRNYIVVKGFKIKTAYMARLNGTTNVTLENIEFSHYADTSTYAGQYGIEATNTNYSVIKNCQFYGSIVGTSGQDMIFLSNTSHHNIIEDCLFVNAGHTLISLKGAYEGSNIPAPETARFNVVKNCYFYNTYHHAVNAHGGCSHTLFENNVIERAGSGLYDSGGGRGGSEFGCAWYTRGFKGIFRNNIAMKSGSYTDVPVPAIFYQAGQDIINGVLNYHPSEQNKTYNNVLFNNYGLAVETGYHLNETNSPYPEYGKNNFINNLIYNNGESGQYLFNNLAIWYEISSGIKPAVNTWLDIWKNNLIEDTGESIILDGSGVNPYTVSTLNSSGMSELPGTVFSGNTQGTPTFAGGNLTSFDFSTLRGDTQAVRDKFALSSGSGISQGTTLTSAVSSGTNSNSIQVTDSSFFAGGTNPANWNGIIPGDTIQVGLEVVQITSIDYNTHTLTLNRNISWANGAKVSFPYTSSAPDIGLLTASTPAPTNVKYVNQDGSGDYTSIAQVNAASIASGWTVSFKSGQTFTGQLVCKTGVTYNTYGGTAKAQIGSPSNAYNPTIYILYTNDVTIDNLKIYTGATGITHSQSYLGTSPHGIYGVGSNITISNCEIIGGNSAHKAGNVGIFFDSTDHININHCIFHDLFFGAEIYNPNYVDVGYNTFYDIWYENGGPGSGGTGCALYAAVISGGAWDCNYNTVVHHNEVYNHERFGFTAVTVSNAIFEYNTVHDNLDETIYQGGLDRGGFGKMGDYKATDGLGYPGSIGNIIRYNTVYNIRRHQASNIYTLTGGGTYTSQTGSAISPGSAMDMWIYGNLIYNCDPAAISTGYQGNPAIGTHSYALRIFNNTIYNCGGWAGMHDHYGSRCAIKITDNTRAFIKNNIIHVNDVYTNSNGYGNAIFVISSSTAEGGNNIFVNRSSESILDYSTVTTSKVAIFEMNGDRYTAINPDMYNTNPLFETGKYTLTSQSLAINAGVTLGNDGDGTPIRPLGYTSGAVDIGYAEYGYGGAVITYDEPPYITVQPENQSGFAGGSATFTVSAESTDTLGYQWWKEPYVSELESKIVNSTKYSGATTNTLIINNLSTSDSTSTNGVSYVCEVYNTNDPSNLWQNSNSATLSVLENTGRVTSGVMSLYDFGETSGQTVSDSISPAINLTITGTVKQ